MKKLILSVLAVSAVCLGLTACSNNDGDINNDTAVPHASDMPYAENRVPADNGVVTDTNGIIGERCPRSIS